LARKRERKRQARKEGLATAERLDAPSLVGVLVIDYLELTFGRAQA